MKYDGRKLTAPSSRERKLTTPSSREIIAVWDYTSKPSAIGPYRWLCKSANEELYLYWCRYDGKHLEGHWSQVSDFWCKKLVLDHIPVWTSYPSLLSPPLAVDAVQSKPVEPVKPIDMSWVIRSDGSCYYHGDHTCEHRNIKT